MGLWFRLLALVGSAQRARTSLETARDQIRTLKATAQGYQTKAFLRTREQAQQGKPEAQYRLAEYYYEGTSVVQDYHEAFAWFLKAAEQGHLKAQLNAGLMLSLGRGAPRDPALARQWLQKAAAQGSSEAEAALKRLQQRT